MTELDVIAHEGEVLEDGTAKLIASRLPRFRGDARLYRVEPGMAYIARGDEELFSNYVVVSGVDDFYVCETYIFPERPVTPEDFGPNATEPEGWEK